MFSCVLSLQAQPHVQESLQSSVEGHQPACVSTAKHRHVPNTRAHTHSHTHWPTHIPRHTQVCTHPHMLTYWCTHTVQHVHTHTHKGTLTYCEGVIHADTHVHSHACWHRDTHWYICEHDHAQWNFTHTQICTHTLACRHSPVHSYAHRHIVTLTYTS